MISRIYFLVIVVSLFLNNNILAQDSYPLEGLWKFKTGDDSLYRYADFIDTNWKQISITSNWESQGFPGYDGIAWYRKEFELKKIDNKENYILFLGCIDDVDETYLNGVKIGGMGTFPPNYSSEWSSTRVYSIPKGLLKKKNCLAVRVYDGGGPGGIFKGPFAIYSQLAAQRMLAEENNPKQTFHTLVTSNGLIAAVYDDQTAAVSSVYPHIFQAYEENKPVVPFIKYIRLTVNEKPKSIKYLDQTHIIKSDFKKFTTYVFSSFILDHPIFYYIIEGNKKEIDSIGLRYERTSTDLLVESASVRFQGKDRTAYLFSYRDSLQDNSVILAEAKKAMINIPNLVERELKFMKDIHKKCKRPSKLAQREQRIFKQSVTVLKMAQVSQMEIFPQSRGQILASLPPGIWNISWIRDGSYACTALIKLGLLEEAKHYIEFILSANVGFYKSYVFRDQKDHGIGSDYQISVCRYFGIGKEESDFNQDGPNIELDGFGLFLKLFSEYIETAKDTTMFNRYIATVKYKIAEPLLLSIAPNGLIRKDSGPWERHLPGKQYAYTSITASAGLMSFSSLLQLFEDKHFQKYLDASGVILNAIKKNLVNENNYFKASAESNSISNAEYIDAATFEAFNFFPSTFRGIFAGQYTYYSSTLQIPKRGFRRVNGGDWYDSQEWVFLDCRIINALQSFGYQREAQSLKKLIINQALLNNDLIPELFSEKNGGYEGAIPMVGFGAGAFILTYF